MGAYVYVLYIPHVFLDGLEEIPCGLRVVVRSVSGRKIDRAGDVHVHEFLEFGERTDAAINVPGKFHSSLINTPYMDHTRPL